jgi:hypothetical protein
MFSELKYPNCVTFKVSKESSTVYNILWVDSKKVDTIKNLILNIENTQKTFISSPKCGKM